MQFIYNTKSGEERLNICGEDFHYIFSVRRSKKQEYFNFANMKDSTIYRYKLESLYKKEANFILQAKNKQNQRIKNTHIITGIIDMNEFSKTLPMLNELMVKKITLFYADFSQHNQKVNFERLERILIKSSMQCGRINMLKLEVLDSLDEVLKCYNEAIAIDFVGEIDCDIFKHKSSFIIGPEGGFSSRERILLNGRSYSINHNLIMRNTTIGVFIASNC